MLDVRQRIHDIQAFLQRTECINLVNSTTNSFFSSVLHNDAVHLSMSLKDDSFWLSVDENWRNWIESKQGLTDAERNEQLRALANGVIEVWAAILPA